MSRLCADINKTIGDFRLDVRIESDASRIGILGASGSGKSMTLRCIAGIEDMDSGHIEVNGKVLYDTAGPGAKVDLKPQERSAGYMFQNYALFPTMSVLKNVMCGLGKRTEENRVKAMDMLKRFGMAGYEKRLPGELSGGQQQRAALARIMVTEPEVILLDEPFSALDGYLRDRMQTEMKEMLEDYSGQVIMVSHNRDELYRFSEELLVIREGSVLRSGPTKELFRDPGRIEVAKLTGCKNFSDAVRVDEHTINAVQWGINLKTERNVPEGLRHIGYRAHHFEPVWGERQENCIKFDLARVDELPFEKNYYFYPEVTGSGERRQGDETICWFVQGDKQAMIEKNGLPDYLKLKEEELLLLE